MSEFQRNHWCWLAVIFNQRPSDLPSTGRDRYNKRNRGDWGRSPHFGRDCCCTPFCQLSETKTGQSARPSYLQQAAQTGMVRGGAPVKLHFTPSQGWVLLQTLSHLLKFFKSTPSWKKLSVSHGHSYIFSFTTGWDTRGEDNHAILWKALFTREMDAGGQEWRCQVGNNNGHPRGTEKTKWELRFFWCSSLRYLQISIWNLIILPWVKMTELFLLQVSPFVWDVGLDDNLHSCAPVTAFGPESRTDLPLSTQPGESYHMSATSSNLISFLMPLGAENFFREDKRLCKKSYFINLT